MRLPVNPVAYLVSKITAQIQGADLDQTLLALSSVLCEVSKMKMDQSRTPQIGFWSHNAKGEIEIGCLVIRVPPPKSIIYNG